MAKYNHQALADLNEDKVLRDILTGTAPETGQGFFRALVEHMAKAMNTRAAMVCELVNSGGEIDDTCNLRAIAFWVQGQWNDGYEYCIADTPCQEVVEEGCLFHYVDDVQTHFPTDNDLKEIGIVSYMGSPLFDNEGNVIGTLALMDSEPMPEEPRVLTLIQIFAQRASAELRRRHAENEVFRREEKLGRLVDSAMDAIVELDQALNVTRVNQAATKVFCCESGDASGKSFADFLTEKSYKKLESLARQLNEQPQGKQYLWIPGGLEGQTLAGATFPGEASLSRFEMQGQPFYTLILRDVNARFEAEQQIESLTVETQYLREEIKSLHNFGEIVGQCPALMETLRDLEQVAGTDATVLINGETGTGKELVARAIHHASGRRDKALIKVNCAAIPENLIESEFFGHEKGAFTGAIEKRHGRFALADGGTIFLDEVGDLPLDLQSKLLRVLQEGEFEPVGSSITQKVDVRVLAATHRDLKKESSTGSFREDLFYRLNVFPLTVPPLRERSEDIEILVNTFIQRYAKKMGRQPQPISAVQLARLQRYNWPGNIRELENVIERALITSHAGELNLDRALPETTHHTQPLPSEPVIYSVQQMQQLERDNIERALRSTRWTIAGPDGAAQLLGIKPTTLSSRIKALGLNRP